MNRKQTRRALIHEGKALCPKCGALLCKVYYGAEAHGVELWCSNKSCKMPVILELDKQQHRSMV